MTDEDGNSALHFLVDGDDSKDVIEQLVDQGANVNARNRQGKTPLHHASIRLQTRVIQCLLHAGADSSVKDNSGATPLHYLVLYYRLDVEQYAIQTLQRGMRNRAQQSCATMEDFGQLAHYEKDELQSIHVRGYSKYLKNKQDQWDYLVCRALALNLDILPDDRVSPCDSDSKEHLDITKLLLCHTDTANVKDKFGRTALHIAATNGYVEIAKYLIEQYQADINIQDVFGTNALHEAVSNGHPNMVKLLLCASKKSQCMSGLINCRECYRRQTALHKAIENDNTEILDELLRHSPDVNATDFAGNVPIHSAITGKQLISVRTLLSAGADIKVQDAVGNTLLHTAAALRTSDALLEIAKELLHAKNGVDVNMKNYVGRTALHFAVWNAEKTEMIRLLCESGARVNIADDYGNTPIHLMDHMTADAIEVLITHDADINVRNNQRMTPLHKACVTRRRQCVTKLLQYGAESNAVDAFGASPLHYACCMHLRLENTLGYDPNLRALMERDADCNIQMKVTGKTPLHLACKKLNYEIEQTRELMRNKNMRMLATDVLGNSVSHFLALNNEQFIPSQFKPDSSSVKKPVLPRNHCGLTWLHVYAKSGNFDQIRKVYLPYAAMQDNLGRSCLHIALSCGYHLTDWLRDDYGLCAITDFLGRNCFHHMCIANRPDYNCCSDSFLQLVFCHPELINARDGHGRTPLFYAVIYQSRTFVDQLLSAGADPGMIADYVTVTDDTTKTVQMKSNVIVKDSKTSQRQTEEKDAEPSVAQIYEIWKKLQPPAASTSYIRVLREQTREFVLRVMTKVAELDSLLKSTPTLVGSSLEGTRADITYDEFDFMVILENFQPLLDYSSHHERFPTYIRLKQQDNPSKTRCEQYTDAQSVVQPIFVKERLYSLLIQACYSPGVWRNSPFEYLRTKLENDRYSPAVAVKMSLNNLIDDEQRLHFYSFRQISVDFVPAVPTNWKLPKDTKFARYVDLHVPETVDRRGFAVLKPHKYSVGNDTNGYCPVTFIYLESEVIRQLPTVRAAYTMMKWLLFCRDVEPHNHHYEVRINKYALKTCVIHCVVEARFRQETLREVTEANLTHCLQVILQQLWKCVQEDRIQNVAMPDYYQPVWKFEPFAGFMKAYLSLYGLSYTSDLYDPDMRGKESLLHGLNSYPSDLNPTRIQKKPNDVIGKFRHSYAGLRKICEIFSVKTNSNNCQDTEQCSMNNPEHMRQDLISYAIKYNDFGNEFDVHENTWILQIESPHCISGTKH